jgi:hypothetical protein
MSRPTGAGIALTAIVLGLLLSPISICLLCSASRAAEASELHDITSIEEVPPAPPGPRWWLWALGLGGVVLLGGLALAGWELVRRRARAATTMPPEPWALAELARIEALDLPAAGAFERYHTLVSDVIRRYLELRFGLHAPEQTTAEFLASVRQSPHLTTEQQTALGDFLKRCDVVKFAGVGSTLEECRCVADMARQCIALLGTSTGKAGQTAAPG